MTTVSTGAVSTSGSTTYVSSLASGLDTNALITSAVAQKTAAADRIDAKVAANEARIAAYQQLQSLVSAVSGSIKTLAAATDSALTTSNSFDAKQAFLSATGGITATDKLAVTVSPEAVAASYDIEIIQLAAAMKVAATTMSGSTALGLSGSFTIGTEEGGTAQVNVTDTMTLSDITKAIASAGAGVGVAATLIQVSSGQYRLTLSAMDTGTQLVAAAGEGDDILASIGLTTESGAFANVLKEPQNAIVVIDDVTIERNSNELSDIIPGVDISLLGLTEGATITLSVELNYEGVKSAITSFIDSYNALRTFVTAQQAVGADGTVPEDAVLFADSLLRTMTSLMRTLLSEQVGTGSINSLSDIGIEFTADNQLKLADATLLDNLILTNASALQAFFETSFTTSDPALRLLSNTTTASLEFKLDVAVDETGAITSVTADGKSGMFTVEGSRIIGLKGTIYEGVVLALVSSESLTIDVSLKQGFANLLNNFFDAYGNASTGIIQKNINAIASTDDALRARADRIRENADAYRSRLVERYAAMETKIQAALLLQQQIEAILGGGSDE